MFQKKKRVSYGLKGFVLSVCFFVFRGFAWCLVGFTGVECC